MVNAYAKPEAFNKMLAGKAGLQLEMLHVKSLKLKIPWFNWSAGQLLTPTPTLALALTLNPQPQPYQRQASTSSWTRC